MGEIRNAYRILVGKPEGKVPLWRVEANIKTIIFKKQSVRMWTGFTELKMGTSGRFL
jgi:hypothetical protein